MIWAYLKAALVLAAVAAGWVAVQAAWRRAFRHECRFDPDVLASRGGCGTCRHDDPCERRGDS